VRGASYELLQLASVVGGSGVIAGVAAIMESEEKVRYVKQAQLLATLAAHLIEGGDVIGQPFVVS
jgi:hypothetical protein